MILKIVNKSTKRNKEQRYFEEKEKKKTNIELDRFLDHLESDNKFLEEKEI